MFEANSVSSIKQMNNRVVCLVVLLGIIASGQICAMTSASPATQDRALAFIEDVLPIDSAKWYIELVADGNASDMQVRELLNRHNISAADNDKVLIYFLASKVGTADGLEATFIIRENNFFQAVINIDNAPSYNDFGGQIEKADLTSFLAKYQSWSGLDSTKMNEMLSNINIAENTIISYNDMTMNIEHTSASYDRTELSWTFLNESDSREFRITFQKDFPVGFRDERQVSPSNSSITPAPTIASSPTSNDYVALSLTVAVIIVVIVISVSLALLVKKKRLTFHK